MTAAVPGLLAGAARIAAAFDIPGFMSSGKELGGVALKMGTQAAASFASGFQKQSNTGGWVETPMTQAMKKAFSQAERMALVSGQAVAQNFMSGMVAIRSGDPGASFAAATNAVSSFIGVAGTAGQAIADVASEMDRFGPAAEYVGNAIGIATSAMTLFTETGGQYLGQIAEIGDVYLQLRRTLAASTLDVAQVNAQMALTQEIMGSGAVDHFQDVSQSIGRFARSLNIAGPELRDFTETYAAMAELVGSISPTNIAGVLNAYKPPDGFVQATGEVYDYSEQLTRFTNIIRATGGNAQSMVDSMIRVGPAMRALGYDAGGTALFFGSLIEEGLRGQKLVYGMNQIVEKLHASVGSGQFKTLNEAWGGLLETVKSLQEAGNKDGAIRLLSDFTTPANASLLQEAIGKGVIRDAKSMGEQAGRDFGQSLSDMAAETSSLSDVFENIQQQFEAAVSPLGLVFDSFIISGGNKLVAWLSENQMEVATWAANIADFVLEGFQVILQGIGNLFIGFSEWVNALTEVVGFTVMRIMDPFRLLADTIGKATWLPGSEFFKAFGDGMNKLNEGIGKVRDMDLSKPFREAGQWLDGLGGKLDKVQAAIPQGLEQYQRTVAVEQALRVPQMDAQGNPVLNALGNQDYQNAYASFDAFKKDEAGKPLKDAAGKPIPVDAYAPMIPIRAEMADKVREQLKALNIEIALDATNSMITQVRAADDEARRAWEAWFDSRTKKQIDIQPNAVDKNGDSLNDISDLIEGGSVEVKLVPNDADIQAYMAEKGLIAPGALPTYGPSGAAFSPAAPGVVYGLPADVTRPAILKDEDGVQSSPASIYAAAAIARNFPAVTSIGGGRTNDTAPNTHDIGQSIDIAIPWVNGQLDMAYGDKINAYIQENKEALNVEYSIWRQKDHYDHIDVHFKDGGVAKLRPGQPVQITTPGVTPTIPQPGVYGAPGPVAPIAPAGTGGGIQEQLYQRLLANGLSADQARGILAMNAVEGGAASPMSTLGFVQGQQFNGYTTTDLTSRVAAFMTQWNDSSRRGAGGTIPGMAADGSVTDWNAYMTWVRIKLMGQNGVIDWQGNQQPNPQDYQNRLMEALRTGGTYTPWNAGAWPAGTTPAFIPQPQIPAVMPQVPVSAPAVPVGPVPPAAPWVPPAVAPPASATTPVPVAPPVPAGPAGPGAPVAPDSADWKPDATGKYLYRQSEDGTTFFVDKQVPTLPPVPDKGNFGNTAGGHWRWIDHGGSKYWLFSPDPVSAGADSSGAPLGAPAPAGPNKPAEPPKPVEPPKPPKPMLPGNQPGDPIYDSRTAAENWLTSNFDGKIPAPAGNISSSAAPFDWTKGTPVPSNGQEIGPDGKIRRQLLSDDQRSGLSKAGEVISQAWNFFTAPQVPQEWKDALGNAKGTQQLKKAAGWLWDNLTPFATGGAVFGAGTATSDSIPAWLSNGEFVQNAAAVDHYGTDFMHAVNERRLPKFNTGGFVGDDQDEYSSLPPLAGLQWLMKRFGWVSDLGGMDASTDELPGNKSGLFGGGNKFNTGGEVDDEYSSLPPLAVLEWLVEKLGWIGDLGGGGASTDERPGNKSGLLGGGNKFSGGGEVDDEYSSLPPLAGLEWLIKKLSWIGDLGGSGASPDERPGNKSGLLGGGNKFSSGGEVDLQDLLVPNQKVDLQEWLRGQLSGAGFTADQARGILAMNAVEGGATDPRSVLGFTDSQAKGPEAKFDAFLNQQWNDMSRRPGGKIPGVDATGRVTNWSDYMTWLRTSIVGQNGLSSDWEGNAQPPAADYQRRLMQALTGGAQRPLGFNTGGEVDVDQELQKQQLLAAFRGAQIPATPGAMTSMSAADAAKEQAVRDYTQSTSGKLTQGISNALSGTWWLDKLPGFDTDNGFLNQKRYIPGLSEAAQLISSTYSHFRYGTDFSEGSDDLANMSLNDLLNSLQPMAPAQGYMLGQDVADMELTGAQRGASGALMASMFLPGKIGKRLPPEGKFADLAGKPHNLSDILARTEGYKRGSLKGVDIDDLSSLDKRTKDHVASMTELMLGLVPDMQNPLRRIGVAPDQAFDSLGGAIALNRRESGLILLNETYFRDIPRLEDAVVDGSIPSLVKGYGEHPFGIEPDFWRTPAAQQVVGHEMAHQIFPGYNANWATQEFSLRNAFVDLYPEYGLKKLEDFNQIKFNGGAPFDEPFESLFRDWAAQGLPTYSYNFPTPSEALVSSQDRGVDVQDWLHQEESPANAIEDLIVHGFNLSEANAAIVADVKGGLGRASDGNSTDLLPSMPLDIYGPGGFPRGMMPDVAFPAPRTGLDAIFGDINFPSLGGGARAAGDRPDASFSPGSISVNEPDPFLAALDAPVPSVGPVRTADEVREMLGVQYGRFGKRATSQLGPDQYMALLDLFKSAPAMSSEQAGRLAVENWPYTMGSNPFSPEQIAAIRAYTDARAPFYDLSSIHGDASARFTNNHRLEMAKLIEELDSAIEESARVPAGGMTVSRAMGKSWRKDINSPYGATGFRQESAGFQSTSPGVGDVTPWLRETMARIFLPEGTQAIYVSTPTHGDLPGGLRGVSDAFGAEQRRMEYGGQGSDTLSTYPNQNELILPRHTGLTVVKEFDPVSVDEYFARQEEMLGVEPGTISGNGAAQGWNAMRDIQEVWMVADQPKSVDDLPENWYRYTLRQRLEAMADSTYGQGDDVPPFADGGSVYGPGTGTSDSIPAWLSNGEFVHNAAAVDYYGTDFMHAVNGMSLPKFAPGGEVGYDPTYPTPASGRPMVGGGQPLPYELANYRGQYDSGPGSQFQAGPENNPFVYIPLGPKISFEAALSAIEKYVRWQEQQYSLRIEEPKKLEDNITKFSESYNKAIEEAVAKKLALDALIEQRARDMGALKPGQDPTFIENQYRDKIAKAEGEKNVAERARVQEMENYEGALKAKDKNLADSLALEVKGPPGRETQKGKVKGDKDAENLGVGLVQGVLQGLGFGDVFGDFFTEWGIWKKGMGALGFGMNVAQNAGLLPKPGSTVNSGLGPGGAQGVTSGALQTALPGLGNLPGIGAIPGLSSLPGTNVPNVSPASSVTPAMAPAAPDALTQTGGSGPAPGPMVQITQNMTGLATREQFNASVHGANRDAAANSANFNGGALIAAG